VLGITSRHGCSVRYIIFPCYVLISYILHVKLYLGVLHPWVVLLALPPVLQPRVAQVPELVPVGLLAVRSRVGVACCTVVAPAQVVPGSSRSFSAGLPAVWFLYRQGGAGLLAKPCGPHMGELIGGQEAELCSILGVAGEHVVRETREQGCLVRPAV
jgi:hypothetical protein